MSHRTKEYQAIIDSVEEKLRKVMSIPENYKVIFLQGGASGQFASYLYPVFIRIGVFRGGDALLDGADENE